MKKFTIMILAITFCGIIFTKAEACSAFFLNTNTKKVAAFNADWPFSPPSYIFTNIKNQAKTAYMPWNDKPLKWKSKYNSITLNIVSIDFPQVGMNEKGLTILTPGLVATEYPKKDSNPAIGSVQWAQYQLDTSATVKDVVKSVSNIRILNYTPAIEYLVSDREGNSAVIEFINGKPVIHTGKSLPVPVITNRTYSSSIKMLKDFNVKTQNSDFAQKYYDLYMQKEYPSIGYARFILATYLIKQYQTGKIKKPIVDYAYFILSSISQKTTQWSIAFDPLSLSIYYKTRVNPNLKEINFSDFDFSKNQMIDMNKNFINVKDITENFSLERNNEIMHETLKFIDRTGYKSFLPKFMHNRKDINNIYNIWAKKMPEYIENQYSNKQK